jgi:hypothetical protein
MYVCVFIPRCLVSSEFLTDVCSAKNNLQGGNAITFSLFGLQSIHLHYSLQQGRREGKKKTERLTRARDNLS